MVSVTVMPGWPARVVTVDVSRSLLPNSRVSSTTPVTLISPESPSMLISTLWAGVLAMRPCRLLRTVPLAIEFRGAVALQAAAAEQFVEALSQPRPLGSERQTSDGWTGPFTGECQPSCKIAEAGFPDAHAAGGQDDEPQGAVVDLDHVNAPAGVRPAGCGWRPE